MLPRWLAVKLTGLTTMDVSQLRKSETCYANEETASLRWRIWGLFWEHRGLHVAIRAQKDLAADPLDPTTKVHILLIVCRWRCCILQILQCVWGSSTIAAHLIRYCSSSSTIAANCVIHGFKLAGNRRRGGGQFVRCWFELAWQVDLQQPATVFLHFWGTGVEIRQFHFFWFCF